AVCARRVVDGLGCYHPGSGRGRKREERKAVGTTGNGDADWRLPIDQPVEVGAKTLDRLGLWLNQFLSRHALPPSCHPQRPRTLRVAAVARLTWTRAYPRM